LNLLWKYTKQGAFQMKKVALFTGLIAALLGGLWLLQGLGIVHMQPILCFANCIPVQGPSATWAIIGGVTLAVGCVAMFWSMQRHQG
jgi:hypothetical protein